jgi:hypothetical protein
MLSVIAPLAIFKRQYRATDTGDILGIIEIDIAPCCHKDFNRMQAGPHLLEEVIGDDPGKFRALLVGVLDIGHNH